MSNVWAPVVGAMLLVAAAVGSALYLHTSDDLVPAATPPEAANLSIRIPPGTLAVALRVDSIASVASSIKVNDRIDVYAYFPPEPPRPRGTTRLVASDLLAYEVAPLADGLALTVAAPPQQALLLQQITQAGERPYIVLRSGQGGAEPKPGGQFADADLAEVILRIGAPRSTDAR